MFDSYSNGIRIFLRTDSGSSFSFKIVLNYYDIVFIVCLFIFTYLLLY